MRPRRSDPPEGRPQAKLTESFWVRQNMVSNHIHGSTATFLEATTGPSWRLHNSVSDHRTSGSVCGSIRETSSQRTVFFTNPRYMQTPCKRPIHGFESASQRTLTAPHRFLSTQPPTAHLEWRPDGDTFNKRLKPARGRGCEGVDVVRVHLGIWKNPW